MRVVVDGAGPLSALRRGAKLLIGCALGAAFVGGAFVASFYFAMRVEMRASEVQVPDLAGLTLEEARERAAPLDLSLQVLERRHDPAVASDRVLEQTPRPGDRVRRGRKVRLVLSLGGEVLEVPSLVGRAARTVEIELRRGDFAPGFEVHVPRPETAGSVLAQVPRAGTPSVPATRVHRLVSAGPERACWVMPDLAGASRADAERWAQRAQVRVATRSVGLAGRAAGTIIGQAPQAGYPVRAGEIVELTLAR